MSSFEQRFFAFAQENLDLDADHNWDQTLAESDISSVDAVTFIKLASREFGVDVSATALADIDTMRELAKYIEARAA